MNSLATKWKGLPTFSVTMIAVFFIVTVVGSATVISTSIQTDGTLSVTGTSTLLGNVGIGTTTTTYGLNVVGDVNLGSTTNKLRIGGNIVLSVPNADAMYLGIGAGVGATDTYNTAVGTGALGTAGGHYGNVAVGWGALNLNTTGGNDNVAVGNLALWKNTSAHRSVAVGVNALKENTTGEGNVGVGYNALLSNTTGIHNTVAGALGMQSNTTGNENAALGDSALYSNTTGSDNVGVGFQAGYGGVPNTTGSNNTFLGAKSGPGANNLTNATAVGYGAIVGTSSSLVLGGTGVLAVNVGIGTTTPVANLQVANGSNATTTMEVGSTGQNKGSCLKLYRTDGTAIYAYVAAGATTFTLTTTACATVANF